MTGGGYPDGIKPILEAWRAGRRDEAVPHYERWLPLINLENRQCGLLAAKALMKAGGIIACEAPRHPLPPLHPESRAPAARLRAPPGRAGAALGEVGQPERSVAARVISIGTDRARILRWRKRCRLKTMNWSAI